MVKLFYTTFIGEDLAHHEIFRAKVGKGGTMMYNLGLISSCTGPFLQTYPKIALYPPPTPVGVQISLYGNKLRQVEGDSSPPNEGVYSTDTCKVSVD